MAPKASRFRSRLLMSDSPDTLASPRMRMTCGALEEIDNSKAPPFSATVLSNAGVEFNGLSNSDKNLVVCGENRQGSD